MIAIAKCLNYAKKISPNAMHITLRFKRNSTEKFENPGDMALSLAVSPCIVWLYMQYRQFLGGTIINNTYFPCIAKRYINQ